MLQWIAYNLILSSLSPALLLWGLWRLVKGKSRTGWGQRLGVLRGVIGNGRRQAAAFESGGKPPHSKGAGRPRIWVHACSVGEVNAVRPVIKELRKRRPEALIFLSTITPTGQAQARRSCPEANAVFYFPFDLLPCVWLALQAVKPDLCLLTEKELWPNFLALCSSQEVPVVVVSGAISDHTASIARWCRGFMRWQMGMVSFFSVQTGNDRRRLRSLGVQAENIAVDGNTKFDQPLPPAGKEQELAAALGWEADTPALVAGSTHPGEEEIVLEAFLRLRERHPETRLLLAPRHPERTAAVAEVIQKTGLEWVRRSELGESLSVERSAFSAERTTDDGQRTVHAAQRATRNAQPPVVLLDTIGELSLTYRLARAAFIGGSLLPHLKGHNPLEALAEGRPVFFGPHMRDHRDTASLLVQEGVAQVVCDAAELAFGWQKAIEDREWRENMGARGKQVMARHQGASQRVAERALQRLESQISNLRSQISDLKCEEGTGAKGYLLQVIDDKEKGAAADLIRLGLGGISGCYRAGLAANLALYQAKLLSRKRLSCPVISIGNITLGGTGKTLATLAVCQWLLKKGITPAVLSRGYGGDSTAPRLVSDGKRLHLNAEQAGDEPFLLAASLPAALVVTGKDRRRSAAIALELGAQALVLDDGFQYWKIEKDAEIVLVDALSPFHNGRLFPRGLLREPLSALRRARAIWITHSDLVEEAELARLTETLEQAAPECAVACTFHQPIALRDFTTGDKIGLWALEGKRVAALSGIGNPLSFELMLRRLGAEVIPARFPDHHLYQKEEIARLVNSLPENVSAVITTAKDAVRLSRVMNWDTLHGPPLRILEVRLAQFSGPGKRDLEELLEEAFSWLTRGRRR